MSDFIRSFGVAGLDRNPIPGITRPVVQLVASRDRDSAHAIAMTRHGFVGRAGDGAAP